MALADIQEKQSDERKREKRLVHVTNVISRDFQNSKTVKSKAAAYRGNADFISKSFLDYAFFNEHKELKEINESHVNHFMLEYAPRKLKFTSEGAKKLPEILSNFLIFLETEGHIHNGVQLSELAKSNSRSFLKLIPKKRTRTSETVERATLRKKVTKKAAVEVKVGRNDPCPCGSGKKYKKCCGKLD